MKTISLFILILPLMALADAEKPKQEMLKTYPVACPKEQPNPALESVKKKMEDKKLLGFEVFLQEGVKECKCLKLRNGDVIVARDGKKIESEQDLLRDIAIFSKKPGSKLDIIRAGKKVTLTLPSKF